MRRQSLTMSASDAITLHNIHSPMVSSPRLLEVYPIAVFPLNPVELAGAVT
jgi:hypothetical protein